MENADVELLFGDGFLKDFVGKTAINLIRTRMMLKCLIRNMILLLKMTAVFISKMLLNVTH